MRLTGPLMVTSNDLNVHVELELEKAFLYDILGIVSTTLFINVALLLIVASDWHLSGMGVRRISTQYLLLLNPI